jgi:hypothetical protein
MGKMDPIFRDRGQLSTGSGAIAAEPSRQFQRLKSLSSQPSSDRQGHNYAIHAIENRPIAEIDPRIIDYREDSPIGHRRLVRCLRVSACVCDEPMSYDPAASGRLPAPCLVDAGIVVNKADMLRLLNDLGKVDYLDLHEGTVASQGTGYVMDVFSDPAQSTLVANQSLYLNVYSFDYLELARLEEQKTCFNLVQDSRCLRIIPLTTPLEEQTDRNNINTVALEAMVAEALSASWDACLDDDGIL